MFPKLRQTRGQHSPLHVPSSVRFVLDKKEIFSFSCSILCDLSLPLHFQSVFIDLLVHS